MLLARVLASLLLVTACARPGSAPTPAAPQADAPQANAPEPSTTEPSATASATQDAGVRLVVLVRHGEKADASEDPPLSAAGSERAACLAELLRDTTVTHVLSTDLRRTRDTVGPLAAEAGRELEVIADANPKVWAKRLRALPAGAVAVVAGHSNTLPVILRELTGASVTIDDDQYDRLFVVALAEDGGSMLQMRYCAPSGRSAQLLAPSPTGRETLRDALP